MRTCWQRRLGRVAGHCHCSAAAAEENSEEVATPPPWAGTDDLAGGVTPLPIGSDGVPPATLLQVAAKRDACAASRDYRTAQALDDLLTVLTPRSLAVGDFAPPTLEEQTKCYFEHGFCVFPSAVAGPALQQLQVAWLEAERPAREAWQRRNDATPAVADETSDGAFRFPPQAEQTFGLGFDFQRPAFTALLEHATLRTFFEQICSTGDRIRTQGAGGGLRLVNASGLVLTPDPPGEPAYISWHRDKPRPDGWPHPRPRVAKMFVYPFGVSLSEGPTTLVPGSHRLPNGPQAVGHVAREPHLYVPTLAAEFVGPASNEIGGRGNLPLEAMPNAVPMVVEPGTAVVFDNACWHTALPHRGGEDRRSLVISFQSAGEQENSPMVSPEKLQELEAAGVLTPAVRSLLGATVPLREWDRERD